MPDYSAFSYTQTVERHIPSSVRVTTVLLDVVVALFAFIGLSGGLLWGIMALGLLVFAWYLMGSARVTYIYHLNGSRLKVQRVSGFKSRPKTVDFADLELTKLRVMAPEDSAFLNEAEAETKDLQPKRITYDVSAHDPHTPCSVMFLEGVGAEGGRALKVYFHPAPALREYIARIRPGCVRGYEE